MDKKNLSSLKACFTVLGYTIPVVHQGNNPYIDFYYLSRITRTKKRKKIMLPGILNRLKKSGRKRDATRMINQFISDLTAKLEAGWRPDEDYTTLPVKSGVEITSTKIDESVTVSLSDMQPAEPAQPANRQKLADLFDRFILSCGKKLRPKSLKCYESGVNVLRRYNDELDEPIVYVDQFTREYIATFLEHIYLDRNSNARTRNNYLGICSAFGTYLEEKGLVEVNPTLKISKLVPPPKRRQPLTEEMLKELHDFLSEHDPYFLLACQMQYYTLIRPNELAHIRLSDISLKDQTVTVTAEVSKNKRGAKVGLSAEVIHLMLDLGVLDNPPGCYLFSKDFRPGVDLQSPDIFNKRWCKWRARLKWSPDYKFYSLKDSGIRDLANSEGIVIARDQARHTDIATTNKYLGQISGAHEETKKFKGFL